MKYLVSMSTGASGVVEVEADSPDEAVDKACEEMYVSICHQCAREVTVGDEWEPEAAYEVESNKEVWTANREDRP